MANKDNVLTDFRGGNKFRGELFKRQRPKSKSNFALIKQINNETSDLQRSHPH